MAVATGLALCVAVGDGLTGAAVSFTLLYLGPVALATWFVSLRAALGLSAASALVSSAIDLHRRATPLPLVFQCWNLAVQLGAFLALAAVFKALKERLALEQQLARTDPLTHIPNRRAFLEMAEVELERSRRTGYPITLAYIDADDFKLVNDQLGHAQGDALLLAVASALRTGTRSIDGVARLGGDEFGLLLVDTDGPSAEVLVERLRLAVDLALARSNWEATFSVGAATFITPPRSLDEMLSHADRLMYEAKRAGKNSVRFEVLDECPTLHRAASSRTIANWLARRARGDQFCCPQVKALRPRHGEEPMPREREPQP